MYDVTPDGLPSGFHHMSSPLHDRVTKQPVKFLDHKTFNTQRALRSLNSSVADPDSNGAVLPDPGCKIIGKLNFKEKSVH